MRILNLYAGIGGNRKLWEDVDVTAVEWNEEIARVYSDNFPNDKVIVADAHQYLLDHYTEFDFIWASPPCPTHSRARFWGWSKKKPIYPDVKLYQEITLLRHHFNSKYVVENVVPYYAPWIAPCASIGRHLFWANFKIGKFKIKSTIKLHTAGRRQYEKEYGFDLSGYNIERKDRKLRNCVHPETGNHILDRAKNITKKTNTEQMNLF